jgi:RimJ/RimL family protein N-acetyltransferase
MPSVPIPEVFLETERLRLRRLTPADLDRLVELDSDPEVMRYISKGRPTSREVLERMHLPRMLGWYQRGPHQGFWVVEERAGDPFLGWFHLRPDLLEPADMELGYRLKRDAWGRGFATEMGRELVRRALTDWGFPRVSGRTLAGNFGSRRVLERCGLRFEAEFVYPESILADCTEEERRAVKYGVTAGG